MPATMALLLDAFGWIEFPDRCYDTLLSGFVQTVIERKTQQPVTGGFRNRTTAGLPAKPTAHIRKMER